MKMSVSCPGKNTVFGLVEARDAIEGAAAEGEGEGYSSSFRWKKYAGITLEWVAMLCYLVYSAIQIIADRH